jgi:crossover junction endodeoxyribonuclease RuvC
MNVIAIDPGMGGAVALFIDGRPVHIIDIPVVVIKRGKGNKREIDLPALVAVLSRACPVGSTHVWLERVSAMPGQGVTSMFSFGRGVGQLEGVLAALRVPVSYVTPQSWQKAVGMAKGPDGARHRASQLMPEMANLWPLKKHHGRADAALIGWYGVRQLQIPSIAATSAGSTVPSHDSAS